jgi:hypothetical protein
MNRYRNEGLISSISAVTTKRNNTELLQAVSTLGMPQHYKYNLKVGCLHSVACTSSGSGFPSNATLF